MDINRNMTEEEFKSLVTFTAEEEELFTILRNPATTDAEIIEIIGSIVEGKWDGDFLVSVYLRNPISEKVGEALARAAEKLDDRMLMRDILDDGRFYNMAYVIALDYFGLLDK